LTDREFKRLSRSQLIDIIYQLQIKQKELEDKNLKLKEELADKRIRMHQAGNIAEASLAIHNVMQAAQDAASQYLEEIRIMRIETEEKCKRLLEKAQKDADDIVAQAQKHHSSADSVLEEIMKEFGKN
jgi:cell division septum initiation protein DivIVA